MRELKDMDTLREQADYLKNVEGISQIEKASPRSDDFDEICQKHQHVALSTKESSEKSSQELDNNRYFQSRYYLRSTF